MRALAAMGIAVAGCGRIAFTSMDPTADGGPVAVGHDEDGDGVDDGLDRCPHLPDPAQLDADGDGVGDACDPEPALARQSFALFSPMTEPDAAYQMTYQVWQQVDDAWRIDGTGTGEVVHAATVRDLDLWFGLDVQPGITKPYQLIVAPSNDPQGTYDYAEIYDDGSSTAFAITHHAGTTFTPLCRVPLAGGMFEFGRYTFHVTTRLSPAQLIAELRVDRADGSTMTYDCQGDTPAFVGQSAFRIYAWQLAVDLRYVALISSN